MEELIKLLRDTRQKKDISLKEVSEAIKIPQKRLEEMENGDFSGFAGEVYLKGAVKSYARFISIDADVTDKMYYQAYQKDKETKNKERIRQKKKPLLKETSHNQTYNGHAFSRIKKEEIEAEESNSVLNTGIFLLLILMLGTGIWFVIFRDKNDAVDNDVFTILPDIVAIEDENSEPVVAEEEKKEDTEKLEYTLGVEERETETVLRLTGANQLEVVISFVGRCWVDLMADNVSVHRKIFEADDEVSVAANREIRLRLGNPPVVRLLVNGLKVKGLSDKKRPHNYVIILSE